LFNNRLTFFRQSFNNRSKIVY